MQTWPFKLWEGCLERTGNPIRTSAGPSPKQGKGPALPGNGPPPRRGQRGPEAGRSVARSVVPRWRSPARRVFPSPEPVLSPELRRHRLGEILRQRADPVRRTHLVRLLPCHPLVVPVLGQVEDASHVNDNSTFLVNVSTCNGTDYDEKFSYSSQKHTVKSYVLHARLK